MELFVVKVELCKGQNDESGPILDDATLHGMASVWKKEIPREAVSLLFEKELVVEDTDEE